MTRALALWQGGAVKTLKAEVCADPDKARVLLDRVIKLEPQYAPAYARRGLAASELGLREESFEDMTKAVRLAPSADNYSLRALVSIRSGQIKAARRDLDYALSLNPKHAGAANYLGVLELGQDDRKAACAAFKNGCAAGDCSFLNTARKEKLCP
jgi:tetratricopeptide (TPR) repeat protein